MNMYRMIIYNIKYGVSFALGIAFGAAQSILRFATDFWFVVDKGNPDTGTAMER